METQLAPDNSLANGASYFFHLEELCECEDQRGDGGHLMKSLEPTP